MEEILNRLNLKIRDLNSLDSDMIQTIFKTQTVKEISILCSVNRTFNGVCQRELLWKEKVLRDYGMTRKTGKTWRETARQAYLESLDRYWYDTLEHDMNYYFIEPNSSEFAGVFYPDIKYREPGYVEPWDTIQQFKEDFVKRALRDRKAISATKILFNAFYLSRRYIQDTEESFRGTVETFMPIFRKAAEVLPGGKIPLQWMLDEADDEEVKIREFDPAAWKVVLDDEKIGSPIIPLTSEDYAEYYESGRLQGYRVVAYETGGRRDRFGRWEKVSHTHREVWNNYAYRQHLSERKLMKQSTRTSLDDYIAPWNDANWDLYREMSPLAGLYKLHPELFVVNEDTEMGMILMNYPGPIL